MNVNDLPGEETQNRERHDPGTTQPPSRIPVIALGLFLLGFVTIMAVELIRARPENLDWRPFTSGGFVRLDSVTVGTTHSIPYPEVSFGRKLQQSVGRLSLAPFFERRGSATATSSSRPGIAIWFVSKDRGLALEEVWLRLPDGQTFRCHGSTSGSTPDLFYAAHLFDFLPYTAATLHITAKVRGETQEWDVKNPTYKPDLAEWTPQSLPAKREVGGYEFTLESLKLRKNSPDSMEVYLSPKTTVKKEGKIVKGISVGLQIRDPAGNEFGNGGLVSSKAWKVVPVFRRTTAFEFPDDQVNWIGQIDTTKSPAPETVGSLSIPEEAQKRGVEVVGVYGPGIYEYQGNQLLRTLPISAAPPGRGMMNSEHDYKTKIVTIRLDKPAFVALARMPQGVLCFRDAADKPLDVMQRYSGWAGDNRSVLIFDYHKSATRIGVAETGLPGVKEGEVEILVSPPPLPK